MKKIMYLNIPMKSMKNNELCFYEKGNADCKYTGKVKFGFIAALYGKIKADDDVLVIMNTTQSCQNDSTQDNINFFIEEFKNVLGIQLSKDKNLKIIEGQFTETRQQMQDQYRELLNYIEEDCWIYVDTTFGPRLNLPITFSVLNFAERFFNAEIKLILNVKVEFNHENGKNEPKDGTQGVFDILPFYNLSNMTMSMKARDGKQALKILDDFFNL